MDLNTNQRITPTWTRFVSIDATAATGAIVAASVASASNVHDAQGGIAGHMCCYLIVLCHDGFNCLWLARQTKLKEEQKNHDGAAPSKRAYSTWSKPTV